MDEILRTDRARYQAMLQGDLTALERLLADDLTYTHSIGVVESKRDYLASVASGRFKYLGVTLDGVSVRLHNDVALMHGTVVLQAVVDGVQRELRNRFLSVWTRPTGQWQLSAWAPTPLPAIPVGS